MKVAAIQMVSGTALDDNLRVARELLEQAALGGAEGKGGNRAGAHESACSRATARSSACSNARASWLNAPMAAATCAALASS